MAINGYTYSTQIITKDGVKAFENFEDGQKIVVLDKNGEWRDATIRRAEGKEKIYDYTFRSLSTARVIHSTGGLKWITPDGTRRTLIEKDNIINFTEMQGEHTYDAKFWCFGFILGSGSDATQYNKAGNKIMGAQSKVHLTKSKMQYRDIFIEQGWLDDCEPEEDYMRLRKNGLRSCRSVFLEQKLWDMMSYDALCNIFDGFITAVGKTVSNGAVIISTNDRKLKEFIEFTSSIAGYHVWVQRDATSLTRADLVNRTYDFYLVKKQPLEWTLDTIRVSKHGSCSKQRIWTIDEPVTKSFVAYGGIVLPACTID